MKKTLIALLALGSMAMGELVTESFSLTSQVPSSTGDIALVSKGENSWSELNWRAFANTTALTTDAPVITLSNGSGWTAIMQAGTAVASGVVTADANGISIGDAANVIMTYTLDVNDILEGAQGTVTSLTLNLGMGANTDTYMGVYILSNGTVTQLTGLQSNKPTANTGTPYSYDNLTLGTGDKVMMVFRDGNAATDVISSLGVTGMKSVEKTVPEPATGTLSLLALAGLCARRRRK